MAWPADKSRRQGVRYNCELSNNGINEIASRPKGLNIRGSAIVTVVELIVVVKFFLDKTHHG